MADSHPTKPTQSAKGVVANGWEVRLTPTAESVYVAMADRVAAAETRGDTRTAHHTALSMVDEVIDRIIPHNPINPQLALTGSLSNIFRYSKGRIRICWIASSAKREVHVLFISNTPRKAGDKRDPYEVFGQLVTSGTYDKLFDRLGVQRPSRRANPGVSIQ